MVKAFLILAEGSDNPDNNVIVLIAVAIVVIAGYFLLREEEINNITGLLVSVPSLSATADRAGCFIAGCSLQDSLPHAMRDPRTSSSDLALQPAFSSYT